MQVIELTPQAKEKMINLLNAQTGKYSYIRLGTRTKGCAGVSYKVEFGDMVEMGDELIEIDGLKILIDNKSLIYLIGLRVDFKETELESGFVFENPNKKGECGCGESFFV
ncbi:MAG TPA: iron-sulfur cluster assembly protein IscA [Alphaproteobacteria bacterium]|nr:iron-sulfur cluster assembly protein IscA [Alphaproteobacteria bacterium]